VKDKLEVSVPELTTQHSVFTSASAALTSFEAASSGAGGAPKLGSVQERMVPQSLGGGQRAIKFFVKDQPSSAEEFDVLAVKLKAAGMRLTDYMTAGQISALCKQHNVELAGYTDVQDPMEEHSPAASAAGRTGG